MSSNDRERLDAGFTPRQIRRRFIVTGLTISVVATAIHSFEHQIPVPHPHFAVAVGLVAIILSSLVALKYLVVDRSLHALGARNAELDAVLAAIPDTILVTDRDATIRRVFTSANSASDELVGLSAEALMTPDSATRARDAITNALDTRSITTVEIENASASRQFEVRVAPIDADRVVSVIRDVTERRAAEHQL